MRPLFLASFLITIFLFSLGIAFAQNQTTPTDETDQNVPRGAADDSGVFNPIWIVIVSVGFVVLVFTGLLMRRRQRPGNP